MTRHGRRPEETTLTVWQVVELARHPDRPYSLDYIRRMAPDFIELHGDRLSGDDPALAGGIGTWHGRTTMFLGHQKGRSLKERVARNWGMMHPEGYRKAIRLAQHAAKFNFPIVWRDNTRKVEAAEQLQLTSRDLLAMGVVEEVVTEPEGSARADYEATAIALDEALQRHLLQLLAQPTEELLQHRYERFRYIDSLIRAEPQFGPKIQPSVMRLVVQRVTSGSVTWDEAPAKRCATIG